MGFLHVFLDDCGVPSCFTMSPAYLLFEVDLLMIRQFLPFIAYTFHAHSPNCIALHLLLDMIGYKLRIKTFN